MLRKLHLFLFLFSITFVAIAQVPAYYSDIDFSKSGNELKTQLTTLISNTHTTILTYTPGVWDVLKQSDLDPTNAANVLLIYGFNDADGITSNDRSRSKDLSCHTSSCIGLWNREHVFARSLGTPPLDGTIADSDAHHIRPADSQMNTTRSNYKFTSGSGNAYVINTSPKTFYPGDEWKGDVARMMMYMFLRYPTQAIATNVGAGSTTYSVEMPDIFLQWNVEDPVSELEITRNNVVAEAQGNRNPFIDNPVIATKIWSGPIAENTWGLTLSNNTYTHTNIQLYPTLTENYVYIKNPENKTFQYKIFNLLGKELKSKKEGHKIDISNLTPGFYFIHLYTDNIQNIYKVIKQ